MKCFHFISFQSGGAGGRPPDDQHLASNTVTSAKVEDSQPEKKIMRTFQQILAEEKGNRNILEIKLKKLNVTNEDGTQGKAKYLSIDEVSVLIFDVLKINPDDCQGVALYTSRYDTKEVKLKPEADPSIYLSQSSSKTMRSQSLSKLQM